MFNLKKIVFIILFINTVINAQVKKIQFISDESQSPLSNVKVYDGNLLIGNSDQNGYFDIEIGNINYIHTIKEDYEDSVIKISDLQEKVILIKSKPIEIEDLNESVAKILNRMKENFEEGQLFGNTKKYKFPNYFKVTNKIFMETDTICFLNGLMNIEANKVIRIDKNNSLIKKSKMAFHGNWNVFLLQIPYTFVGDYVVTENILKKRSNYNYIVTDMGKFYKVAFETKNELPFGFNGYLIVDKKDFGIYEFKAQLSENIKNSEKSISYKNNTVEIYFTTTTDYYIKYQKNNDGIYELICSYSDKQFEQTQGDFKGKKFSCSSKVEASENYKNTDFARFSIVSYEIK